MRFVCSIEGETREGRYEMKIIGENLKLSAIEDKFTI
jgi:hypothetical protein